MHRRDATFLAAPAGILLLPILVLMATSAAAQQESEIAVVIEASGEWRRGEMTVGPGDRILRPDTLHLDPNGPGFGRITVLLADARHVRFNCTARCDPFVPADSFGTASVLTRGVRAMARLHRLLQAAPSPLAVALTRGGGGTLQEAVLGASAAGVDLAPALAELRGGRYMLRLEPVHAGRPPIGTPSPPQTITVDWSPEAEPASAPVEGVTPGLYEIAVLAAPPPGPPPGLPAWILIMADSAELAIAAGELEEGRLLTANWPRASQQEIRTYRRAVLLDLALRTGTLPDEPGRRQ